MVPADDRKRHDLVAFDKDRRPVLVVEVKRTSDSDLERLVLDTGLLMDTTASIPIPFFMLATPFHIWLYRLVSSEAKMADRWKLTKKFNTPAVVKQYDQTVSLETITAEYLAILIDAWLNDLAYSWKNRDPIGRDLFFELGILEYLKTGQRELNQ